MVQKSYDDSPSLYLVPTPIGNMEDITVRSLNVLKTVDLILCEDTRESSKLLKYYDITKKLISCHEYNEDSIKNTVVKLLKDGNNIALITDQGSPIISDPGFIVAKEVINSGYNVISLPGATAFVPALCSSGLNPSPFLFYGFLNAKSSKQKKELEKLKNYDFSIIFYEAPHRIKNTLTNMLEVLGDRKICIGREISKMFEEYHRDNISNLIDICDSFKGEMVIICEGNYDVVDYNDLSIIDHVNLYAKDMSVNEAIKLVAKERNIAKSIVYKEYHIGK